MAEIKRKILTQISFFKKGKKEKGVWCINYTSFQKFFNCTYIKMLFKKLKINVELSTLN